MIIIKGDDLDLISKMMINLEKNKFIFDTKGVQINEEKAINYLQKDGINYKFHSNVFKIYCSHETWSKIERNIREIIVNNDIKVGSSNGYERYSSSNEMELIKTTNEYRRRFITRIKDVCNNKYYIYWCYSNIKCLINDFKGYRQSNYTVYQLLNFNSIVLDTEEIFNFPPGVSILNRPFNTCDFKNDQYIASHRSINILNLNGFIFKIWSPELYKEFIKHMKYFYTINPVREEKINNLQILRCDKSKLRYEEIITQIKKTKKNNNDFIFDELEEARNIACGFPSTFNDICYKCKIPLYDYIYALKIPRKKGNSHMLMCRYCITYLLGSIRKYNLELLKINYPRKMDEVIRYLPIEEKEKTLLIDLYLNPCTIINGCYENDKYKGYKNIKDFLMNKYTHDPNKKAFFYNNLDDTDPKLL